MPKSDWADDLTLLAYVTVMQFVYWAMRAILPHIVTDSWVWWKYNNVPQWGWTLLDIGMPMFFVGVVVLILARLVTGAYDA